MNGSKIFENLYVGIKKWVVMNIRKYLSKSASGLKVKAQLVLDIVKENPCQAPPFALLKISR